MDLQSFIQSGLLEAYVAGQCTAAERQEVERMTAQHPEIRAELAQIEQALENFAVANAVAPPTGLKDRILDKLDKLPDTTTDAPDLPNLAGPGSTKAANASIRLFRTLTFALAAASAVLFWQRMAFSADNKALNAKIFDLKTQVDNCDKLRQQTQPMANLLRDTDTRPIALSDSKTFHTTIFNNKLRKECALDVSTLKGQTTAKYFQCWAIVEGQAPISLGMVRLDAPEGWQPLPYIENAKAYAISEEPNPEGNPKPTLVIAVGSLDLG